MADGSPEDRTGPKQMNDLTFSAPGLGHGDTKKCSGETFNGDRVKLSFYTELDTSESCEKSDTRGVAADRSTAVVTTISRKSREADAEDGDDRKKRCFDRYDSSESSDSGVAVLSPTESSGCSSSDITEPRSPRSPESSCSNTEDSTGVGTRMPPWASEPAPPAQRRLPAQPAPRRSQPPVHRRITEYFNHKMKPQNGLKRDSNSTNNEDTKRKCLPKNGVTHDLEKYISYLSQTLNPKVLMDVGKPDSTAKKTNHSSVNGVVDVTKATDLSKMAPNTNINGMLDFSRINHKDKSYNHTNMNGFVEVRHGADSFTKEKPTSSLLNGLVDGRKKILDNKVTPDPSAKCTAYNSTHTIATKRKMHHELNGVRIAPATSASHSPKKPTLSKADTTRVNSNGVVSSTTKMDSRMNGVTCGSNNLSLHSKTTTMKKEAIKKTTPLNKRTNRKSSACIANSKNLTWSKANNLKQVQLQQQNCVNSTQGSPIKNIPGEPNTTPKMSIPNGMRQVPMTMNGNLGNLNVPVTNFQNCHQINIPQQCNGSVNSNNLASFVAVPQNVMLTTLRIPQNGIPAQTLTQQSNMNAFNRQNVSVTSPTKLNGQFVFPLMQNINGAVVQIPNLMAKMPNFVLPQTSQLTAHQGQEHLQNQQAAQILINGTLLKLANTMTSGYTNVNKTAPVTSQSIPVMNKDVQGMPPVGMKPNYAVNLSQSVFMPQPGFIVTSVPNMNVKETWSYTNTNMLSSPQSSCSNTIMHHPPHMVPNFAAQALHSSSMPIAPVKPPDNPIQGTEPPSSTVKEPNELNEVSSSKCDIPWLSKTVNNNIVPFATNKIPSRAFAEVSFSDKLNEFAVEHKIFKEEDIEIKMEDSTGEDFKKIEEVARREETLFTQITVLKDVSSNVQSSVIEANFCCTTTESSESGIGTDKSIDSPSDSQTSKDCDDDSSLSLSVSVCSVETLSSQKSPILKQPKTLRFPPRNPVKSGSDKRKSSTETSAVTLCLWEDCKKEFDDDTDLLEHLQSVHVESQAGKENYVCLWQQCKVRGKPSCSSLWLQRHALSHTGRKPFKCIVDGCDRRFSTQILLERHVNNHFNEASPGSNGIKKTSESGSKLMRRNGKKLRYRRQPWSARMFDFFDSGMMEGLAWRLVRCTRWRLGGACPLREPRGRHTLALTAAVAATRYNAAHARREALIQYYPPHVLEDEWVPEKEVTRVKRVEIAALPAATKVLLFEQFCASYRRVDPPQRRAAAQAPKKMLNNIKKNAPRHCTSSRLLNNLLAKQKRTELRPECRPDPLLLADPSASASTSANEVTGAKKRKQGRRHGGVNAFLPSGR